MPVQATCLIRADPMSVVRRNSLLQLTAARFNTFCLRNSDPPLSIASLTAFDHAVTRFTPLSDHSYVILEVRVVHCRHSGGSCRAFSAWESARALRVSPRCALTLTMNVRAPRITLSPVAEEQSRTLGSQSGGVDDQPQCRGLWHSSSPSARSLSRSPSPPPPSFTQYPSPPRSLVRDWQTSPHRPRLVVSRA